MEKITEIIIEGEGLQLKPILEATDTYEALAQRFGLYQDTLKQYVNHKQITNNTFIDQLEGLYQKPYNQIVNPVDHQLREYILKIKDNIKNYTTTEDNKPIIEVYNLAETYCKEENLLMAKGNLALYKYNMGLHFETAMMLEEVVKRAIEIDLKELIVYYTVQLAFVYLISDPKKSRATLSRAEAYINNEMSKVTLFNYYYFYGVSLAMWRKFTEARRILNKALDYAIDDSKKARIILNLGVTHHEQKRYVPAMDYYNKALMLCENYTDIKATILNNMANIYWEKGEIGRANLTLQKALEGLSAKYDFSTKILIYDTFLEINANDGDAMFHYILELLDKCVVLTDHQQFLDASIEKLFKRLSENQDMLSLQRLMVKLTFYCNKEGEKRPLNGLKVLVMDMLIYLMEKGYFNVASACKDYTAVKDIR